MRLVRLLGLLAVTCAAPAAADTFDCDVAQAKFRDKTIQTSHEVTVNAVIRLIEPRSRDPYPAGAGIRFRSSVTREDSGFWLLVHPKYPDELTLSYRKSGGASSTVIAHFPIDASVKMMISADQAGRYSVSLDGRTITCSDHPLEFDEVVLSCNSGHFLIETELAPAPPVGATQPR